MDKNTRESGAVKISLLGDITCDRPMLKAAKNADGSFDFSRSFYEASQCWKDADLVIGNLETVCAGSEKGYNPGAITYNSPDELIEAIADAGINLVSTANNHVLDCGLDGLKRTLNVLDNHNIRHIGSTLDSGRLFSIEEIDGIKIAVVAFTATMNKKANKTAHTTEEWDSVLQATDIPVVQSKSAVKRLLKKILPMVLIKEISSSIKRRKGVPLIRTYRDDDVSRLESEHFRNIIEILKQAKEQSDFVIAYVHSGGQFNDIPGELSEELYKRISPYTDVIAGHHPHVVQKAEMIGETLCAYSLGSFNMSPSADYVNKENAPEYSVLLNLYLDKEGENTRLIRAGFTVLHAQEDVNGYVSVKPVISPEGMDTEDKERFVSVFERFTGDKFARPEREYELNAK